MATPDPDIPIAQLVRNMQAKRGLAIIFTNDYSDCPLSTLNGPKIDGETIRGVFDGFNIATYWKHNVGQGGIELVVQRATRASRSFFLVTDAKIMCICRTVLRWPFKISLAPYSLECTQNRRHPRDVFYRFMSGERNATVCGSAKRKRTDRKRTDCTRKDRNPGHCEHSCCLLHHD